MKKQETLNVDRNEQTKVDPAGMVDLDDATLEAVTGGVIFIEADSDTAWDHSCPCNPC